MKILFCFLSLLINISLPAQNKMLTIEDALVKNKSSLAPENLKQVQFIYGTDNYVYLKKINDKDVWIKGNINSKDETVFLTLDDLNQKLSKYGYTALKSFPEIQFDIMDKWILTADSNKIALNAADGNIKTIIPKIFSSKLFTEESKAGFIAYLDHYDLHISDAGKKGVQVTKDGSDNIVYAQSVHRNEFGINKGIFWSNSGKQIAFYRMDQTMVNDYPIIDWSQRPAKNENIKYPMAGGKSHHVTVAVYNTGTKKLVYLKTGLPAEQYLTNIAWSPDDKSVYIAVLNREQNHMKFNQYNAITGNFIKTLFEEKDEKYVEPLVPMLFLKNDPTQFIWQSNRDGFSHLYLYNTNGNLLKQLTKADPIAIGWEVTEVKGFDATGENLFYISTQESPITKNLYELNLKSGTAKRISSGDGIHSAKLSSDGNYIIDVFSNTNNPRTIQLINTKTGQTKLLLQAANPLSDFALGNMSLFTIKNTQGIDLYCRLYKPVNFDSTKKYPVIVYWYGGPHAQIITNSWNGGASDYWFQYMAERGYVVFSLDTRGSDNRGKAFEQAIFRHAGDPQMEDMMSALNYLTAQSFVDKNNMGLFGWSYGGFMTTDFLLNHPGVFKAAVAGGPVMNWAYYEIMYGERYMDTPQENPKGYEATNLIKKAGNLKDKLLLIHGLQDPVVVQQNSVDFVKACVDKGVQVDYMNYPGHEHNVLGKDRAHLFQKITDYFTQNLK